MSTQYEQDLLGMIPKSVTLINTEKFDGYVQLAELALYLQRNNRTVEIIDMSRGIIGEVSLKSHAVYFALVGPVNTRISEFLKSNGISVQKNGFWQVCSFKAQKAIGRLVEPSFDEYEQKAYLAAIRNQNTQTFLENFEEPKILRVQPSHFNFFCRILSELRRINPSQVVISNGRFLKQTLAYLACRRLGIKVSMLEGGGRPYTFELFDSSPHKSSDYLERVLSFHVGHPEIEIRNLTQIAPSVNWLGEATHDPRVFGFLKRQTQSLEALRGLARKSISNYVVYYTSSFWELPSIPEFGHLNPIDIQSENVRKLQQLCTELKLGLIIKIHPNPDDGGYEEKENSFWVSFCNKLGIEYIEATSKVATADVIVNCWLNVVENSGVSLECVAFGAPVITLDHCPWFSSSQVPVPKNLEELKELLRSRPLYPKEILEPYIKYRGFGGIPYRHFKVDDNQIWLADGTLIASKMRYHRAYKLFSTLKNFSISS